MSEENTGIDPLGLGMNLSEVDTSRPCLAEGVHMLSIATVTVADNKALTGKNLVVEFQTVNDSPDVSGEKIIGAGWKITKYYPMQQSDNPKAPDFRADLARLQDAVEKTSQGNRPVFSPFNYIGQMVVARLKVKQDDVFGMTNEIAKLEPVEA